jgi:hypothetical protein
VEFLTMDDFTMALCPKRTPVGSKPWMVIPQKTSMRYWKLINAICPSDYWRLKNISQYI